ncbi:MAG: lipoprotein-releasing ABC transporter permease subunit [bacterium]
MNKLADWSLALLVGLRYTRAKRANHFISFISLTSMIGIALGAMVLIVVLSVMNGFEEGMKNRILSMVPHISVTESDKTLANWQERMRGLALFPHVIGVAPYIKKEMMVTQGQKARGIVLHGINPELEKSVSHVHHNMQKGVLNDLKQGEFGLIIGHKIAQALDVEVGDRLMAINPKSSRDLQQALPELQRFTVVGIFKVDMQVYDSTFAYTHIDDAAQLFELGDEVTGLQVKLDDIYKAQDVSYLIAETDSDGDYWISNWTQGNVNLFRAIQMQKTVMFLILVMIVFVAAFNLVSTLVMVVTDKQSDIAIFRTMGLTPKRVMQIFMVQGTVVGVIGTTIGVALGILLAINVENILPMIEQLLGRKLFSAEVYKITEIQAVVKPIEVSIIAGTSLILSLLATLYPAWKASKVQPAEALRYE